jgi:hypothetical protein
MKYWIILAYKIVQDVQFGELFLVNNCAKWMSPILLISVFVGQPLKLLMLYFKDQLFQNRFL